jgi:hypothetical protein
MKNIKKCKMALAVIAFALLPSMAYCYNDVNNCAYPNCTATICGDTYTWCCDAPDETGGGYWTLDGSCNGNSTIKLYCFVNG